MTVSGGSATDLWHVRFNSNGKEYQLFKRQHSAEAPWYIHVQDGGRRLKKSLETSDGEEAARRARLFLEINTQHRWQSVQRMQEHRGETTLQTVINTYRLISATGARTTKNNVLSLEKILDRVAGHTVKPEVVRLTDLTKALVEQFQDLTVALYQSQASPDEAAQREARDRALRSSRSTICQARSLFSRKGMLDLPDRYQARGIFLPPNIRDFMECKLRGSKAPADFRVPADAVIDRAFKAIRYMEDDLPVYLAFWLAVGAGLRRKEIRFCRWEHLMEIDGRLWVCGGLGKDGKEIRVPIQARAVEAIQAHRKKTGWVISERSDRWAKRLNRWMHGQGWTTKKKMHELRRLIGSKIYQRSPVAAMRFLRHKSIRITESNYIQYAKINIPSDVL